MYCCQQIIRKKDRLKFDEQTFMKYEKITQNLKLIRKTERKRGNSLKIYRQSPIFLYL